MSTFTATDTVGDVVVRRPSLARVFEEMKVDYCCGGKRTIEEACARSGVDSGVLLTRLEEAARAGDEASGEDPSAMSLTQLADHIEETHHAFVRRELERLDKLTEKVASVHGDREPRLRDVRETFLALREELTSHMMKEERILFPIVRQLEAGEVTDFGCGTVANPIQQMEHEHDSAGAALERFRQLTDDYTPPEWACNTYRVLLDSLAHLERDMHQHIHKENNVLFPGAIRLEATQAAR